MNETVIRVAEALRRAKEERSRNEIAAELGIAPHMVSASIRRLRELGYRIESPKRGLYRFDGPSKKLLPYEVKKVLKTKLIGREIRYFDKTTSTNTVAQNLLIAKDSESLHGTIVIAEEQTGGTGRLGRVWVSPGGGIWLTIILKPKIPIERAIMLTMAGSIAVVRAIKRTTGIGALIKWPNDIYIGKKKVGGIITELSAEGSEIHHCLVGIGIDVNIPLSDLPPQLKGSVTSLSAEIGRDVDRVMLLGTLLKEFELRYFQLEAMEYEPILREWKSLLCTIEHRVRIRYGSRIFEGEAIDIDDFGGLLVRKDDGVVERVIAGDCTHI
ncbi:MAG: biotin--[acetyl-CoA-carboxylase] ligase [Methanomicrobiales archaeon]|nr:biotin--[acetyl-CoA-carboxylase] ligase [Methanomicrobiales archaeon]